MVVVHRNNLVLSDDVTTSLDKSIYLYNFFFVFAILITNASRGRKRKLVKNQNINQEKKNNSKKVGGRVAQKRGEKAHLRHWLLLLFRVSQRLLLYCNYELQTWPRQTLFSSSSFQLFVLLPRSSLR